MALLFKVSFSAAREKCGDFGLLGSHDWIALQVLQTFSLLSTEGRRYLVCVAHVVRTNGNACTNTEVSENVVACWVGVAMMEKLE